MIIARNVLTALVILAVLVPLSARGQGNDWQAAVDALRETGGVVAIPCGRHVLPAPLRLWDRVTIRGNGPCTILEGPLGLNIIESAYPSERHESISVESLVLQGGPSYIAVDFRNVSASRVRDVIIRNVRVGVYLAGMAYYNVLEDLNVTASEVGLEIRAGANENTIRGGAVHEASYGIWIQNVSNVQVFGTSFEGSATRRMGTAVLIDTGAVATKVIGSRIEAADVGVVVKAGATQTMIFGIYMESVTTRRVLETNQYWWYGP